MMVVDLLEELRRRGIQLWAEGDKLRFRAPDQALTPDLRAELAARKAEILAFLHKGTLATRATETPTIPAAPRGGPLPLSFAQQRLWFLDQLDPAAGAAYHIPLALLLSGPLDLAALERALAAVVERHEALRTVFAEADGQPVQLILPPAPPPLPLQDAPEGTDEQRQQLLRDWLGAAIARPFDLQGGPLLRAGVLRLGPTEHVLALTLHHIITDGWSQGVLMRELINAYAAAAQGQPIALPRLPVQYADYAVWQRQWFTGAVEQAQLDYWRRQLAGVSPLELPTDRPRPAQPSYRGATVPVAIPAETSARLAALGRETGASLFMVLLAAWCVLLARYSGQRDLTVGTPIAGRTHAELEGLIGFFVNTLVLRADLGGNPSFRTLLERVRATALAAYAHQDVPFERLVDLLQPERDLSRTPLFQVMFVLQNTPPGPQGLEGFRAQPLDIPDTTAKFDLTLTLSGDERGIGGVLRYSADLFEPGTAVRMAVHLQTLLEAAAADPDRPIDALPLLDAGERRLLAQWGAGERLPVPPRCVHELFAEQAARTPGAPALVFEERRLAYAELDRRANGLAHLLCGHGIGPDSRVAICLERSAEMIVALLGILKAGAAYVPLDPTFPAERLAGMLADADARLVVTARALAHLLPAGVVPVWLDELDAAHDDAPHTGVTPSHLAYVIYTSGSTGRPKGVAVEHRQVVNYVAGVSRRLDLPPGASYATVSTIAADLGNTSIYAALCGGGCLHVLGQERIADPTAMAEYMRREAVDCLKIVPSHLRALLSGPDPAGVLPRRRLVLGGEASSRELIAQLRELAPACAILNHYGPTETTVGVLTYPADSAPRGATLPIGRPLANSQVLILDSAGQPTPVGVPGELHIGGAGVARGYLGRPELTAERFVPNPFGAEEQNQEWRTENGEPNNVTHDESNSKLKTQNSKLYKTGDLVRWLPEGAIEFLGRIDQQVKIRGYRIELGEIEATLRGHPDVREAAVIAREDQPGDKRIVAYVVLAQGPKTESTKDAKDTNGAGHEDAKLKTQNSKLKTYLSGRLPDYMVPAAFVVLHALPITANGKLDRRALPAPQAAPTQEGTAPRTPTEELLATIWADVLGLAQVGIHDNFFLAGGHSLLATQALARVRAAFGVGLPVRALFEHPTVAQLAPMLERAARAEAPPIVPAPPGTPRPLSFAQQRIWFLDQLDPGSSAYNIPLALRLDGPLDPVALGRSLDTVVERHESLRTTFAQADGQPAPLVRPPAAVALPLLDLRELPETERDAAVQRRVQEEAGHTFDLERGPLLRAALLALADDQHILLLTMHHIVSDGWSRGVLMREMAACYAAYAAGRTPDLAPLPIQYGDFALWQQQVLRGELLEAQLGYWRERLAGAPAALELPTDFARPAVQSFRGATLPVMLPSDLSAALARLSREAHATMFMTLLAAWSVLLARYSGQRDISVGTPIAGRTHTELEGLIGFFVNTLVLRADLEGNPSFRALLGQVRATALEAYAHQDVPFEQVVEALRPERDLSRTPLFQVMFAFQNTPQAAVALEGLRISQLDSADDTAKFELSLVLNESPQGLVGALNYNTDLFREASMRRLLDSFQTLLEGIVADPDRPVERIPLLRPAAEQELLLSVSRAPDLAVPTLGLHQFVEAQAARTPGATALIAGTLRWSYQTLNARANRLAHHLRALGVGPEQTVGICLPRTADLLVALLATLKAGGAYLPLDPAYPAERLALLLDDARPRVVLTGATAASLPAAGGGWVGVCLPEAEAALAQQPDGNPDLPVLPEQLAYLIYTSGSTGRPKGVAITHANAAALLAWAQQQFSPEELAGTLAATSINFDLSVFELFVPLSVGAAVILAENALALPDLPAAGEVTLVNTVPSAMRELVHLRAVPPGVRTINLAGEPLRRALVQQIALHTSATKIYNLYGPSEDTTYSTWQLVDPRALEEPPIGRPLPGTQAYVLDRLGQPVPVGVLGELFLGGAGLARGYLERPELTAERFVPNPFGAGEQSQERRTENGEPDNVTHDDSSSKLKTQNSKLYKTGDLVYWREDGSLVFVRRADFQVKLRGFRIELGEVEAALLDRPGVADAVVVVREDMPGDPRLVAYVAMPQEPRTKNGEPGAEGAELKTQYSTLKTRLAERLPEYMVPSAIVVMEALPQTPNGKVNRAALPVPALPAQTGGEHAAPRDQLELELARAWEELLGVAPVGIHDDFFALGGHSLLAVRLAKRIEGIAGAAFPLAALFQGATVARVAARLREGRPITASPLVALQPHGDRPPLFLVHPSGGGAFCYLPLAAALGQEQPLYAFQSPALAEAEPQPRRVHELAAQYLALLRERQPEGPYRLGGWSFGGLVAYEMARLLEAEGQAVALLALLDARPADPSTELPDDLSLLIAFAQDLGLPLEQLDLDMADLAERTLDDLLALVLDQARAAQVIPEDLGLDDLRRLLLIFKQHLAAMRDYRPAPYGGPLTLFPATQNRRYDPADPAGRWGGLVRRVCVHPIDSDHFALVRPPHIEAVANALAKVLATQGHGGAC
ncbi:MAG TPA: amino acid adenylation domain-containing protein [Roseiflexaceae bacterium]|nr:amino acid adenylation domain-containing protein [Roseiflexaceae bacterium]